MIIKVGHIRASGLCAKGLRAWCDRNGVSLRALCGDGVDTDDYPQLLNDPFVQQVIAQARIQEEGSAPAP